MNPIVQFAWIPWMGKQSPPSAVTVFIIIALASGASAAIHVRFVGVWCGSTLPSAKPETKPMDNSASGMQSGPMESGVISTNLAINIPTMWNC